MIEYRRISRYQRYWFGADGSIWHWKVKRKWWRQLRPLLSKNPQNQYPFVCIRNKETGKREMRGVHLLIAEAFLGPKPTGQVCRHLDGDKKNTVISNLAYGTHQDNEADKRKHGRSLQGERHHQAKLTTKDVIRIRGPLCEESLTALAKSFGVTPQAIWRIRHKRTWRHV